MSKQPCVWVVEVMVGRKLWCIVGEPSRTLCHVNTMMRELKQANRGDHFRVAKYVRVEPKKKRSKP